MLVMYQLCNTLVFVRVTLMANTLLHQLSVVVSVTVVQWRHLAVNPNNDHMINRTILFVSNSITRLPYHSRYLVDESFEKSTIDVAGSASIPRPQRLSIDLLVVQH